MIKFIKQTFKDLKLFYTSVCVDTDFRYLKKEKDVWTKDRIYDCIVDGADEQTFHI